MNESKVLSLVADQSYLKEQLDYFRESEKKNEEVIKRKTELETEFYQQQITLEKCLKEKKQAIVHNFITSGRFKVMV